MARRIHFERFKEFDDAWKEFVAKNDPLLPSPQKE